MSKPFRLWMWGLGLVLCWGAVMSAAGQDMMARRYGSDKRAHNIVCGTTDPSDSSYYYCVLENRGRVQLVRQLTDFPCIYNRTWGYDTGGVWVQHGCRAEFAASGGGSRGPELPPGAPAPPGPPPSRDDRRARDRDSGRIVTCSSHDKQYAYCAARIRDDVRLHRQLSSAPCRLGRSWGYDGGGIWVDSGCRAEFFVP